MKQIRSGAVLAALASAVALAACGEVTPVSTSASPPQSIASPSPAVPALTGPPAPSGSIPAASRATFELLGAHPPAGFTSPVRCGSAIGRSDSVAIVQLHDGSVVLRDYADPAHPLTACTLGQQSWSFVQLLDSRHLVLSHQGSASCADYAVVDLPAVTYHWFQLPSCGTPALPGFLAISPGLDSVAWNTYDQVGAVDQLHLTTYAGSGVATSLPNPGMGRCGSPDDSKAAAFTDSGNHVYWLDRANPGYGGLVVLAGDRTVLRLSAPTGGWGQGGPKMAVWAPSSETLYYWWAGDVWRWTQQFGAQRYLPGVAWYYPTISPDGHYLAFATVDTGGQHTVFLADLFAGTPPHPIGGGHRTLPVFLNASQLWYRSEAAGACGPGGDQPLVYDLKDGSEAPSVVQMPIAVWPATSSNF